MRIMFTVLLVLMLVSAASADDRTVTVTPVEGPIVTVGPAAPAWNCVYGNTRTPAYAITDWIWGQERYATAFNAFSENCVCPDGFTIQTVHFLMNFRYADVPSTFNASVSFLEHGEGCPLPGAEICTSPVYQVTITDPGVYDIALPVGDCLCAFFGFNYAVAINFPDAFPATQRPDVVTDATPTGCISFNDAGNGWVDTTTLGFPGEISMYVDVACCSPAVPDEMRSWGAMKSLYR